MSRLLYRLSYAAARAVKPVPVEPLYGIEP